MALPQSKPSGERRVVWGVLVLAILAALFVTRHAGRRAPPKAPIATAVDLLRAVPPGPELLITADVAALGAAVPSDLLRLGGGVLLGRELCGFEPLLKLRRVVLATPHRSEQAEGASDFALIAETSLQPEPVLRCAEAVIRQRGGQPVRSSLGRFTSVRDQSRPLGEVAIRGDGLFVLSGGQYFRDVIDAAGGAVTGDEAARVRTAVHAGIRGKLGPTELCVTLLSGSGLPLPGVQALGLGLKVDHDVRLRGFVGCTTAAACGDAREMIERMKNDAAREPSLAALASVNTVQHDAELDVGGRLPREALAPLLSQLLSP